MSSLQSVSGVRIVHVCHAPGSAHAELDVEPAAIAREQMRRGFPVTVLHVVERRSGGALRVGSSCDTDGLRTTLVTLRSWQTASDVARVIREIGDADVVHVHGSEASPLFALIARRLPKSHLVASVYREQDDPGWRRVATRAVRRVAIGWIARRYGHIALAGKGPWITYGECRRLGLHRFGDPSAPLAERVSRLTGIYESVRGQDARAILGARIEVTDGQEVINLLDDCVDTGGTQRLAFVNANLGYVCARNATVSGALTGFTLINDGVGIDLASRLLYGTSFRQNLNGTDFVPEYLDRTRHRLRLFLLGSQTHILEKASREIARRWPRHEVVGLQHGFFSDAESPSISARISDSHADMVLVAMGNPRQELWAAENVPNAAPIAICVGALLDFVAGDVRRAPQWVRQLRMEWLFRLAQEPRRLWRRYTVEGVFFAFQVTKQYFSGARS